MASRRTRQRGVTLIELMIVVGIIAVFGALMFGMRTQTYGANPAGVSEQIAADFNLCKMRAASTRRWHRCIVETGTFDTSESASLVTSRVSMWQWQQTGMKVPATNNTTSCDPVTNPCWQLVQTDNIGRGTTVWDGSAAVCATAPCTGSPTSQNSSLSFNIDFRPDGSSTGGTVYITEPGRNRNYRVVVYKATGASYARNSW
ncbi:MAG: prepilin-type N-terminal cleavage/methylation domain-containing protein [Kofleriaceae bacterium]